MDAAGESQTGWKITIPWQIHGTIVLISLDLIDVYGKMVNVSVNIWAMKKRTGCLGDLLGMKSYPAMWGLE